MKRQTYKRLISLMLIGLMVLCDISPVFAVTDETHIHTETSDHNKDEVEVLYEQDSTFTVTIPKKVTLDVSKTSGYEVTVEGDISSANIVKVVPDKAFLMEDQATTGTKKDPVAATVDQDKEEWLFSEFETIGNGTISAPDLTAGN